MGYQSKTYSLSDEVVDAIERAKAGGTSPNKFLRSLIGLDDEVAGNGASNEGAKSAMAPVSTLKVEGIPGIQVGAADLPKNATCGHCGRRFAGTKGASLCPGCSQDGHRGDVRNCRRCEEGPIYE